MSLKEKYDHVMRSEVVTEMNIYITMSSSFGDPQLTNLRRSVVKKLTGSQLFLTFFRNRLIIYLNINQPDVLNFIMNLFQRHEINSL